MFRRGLLPFAIATLLALPACDDNGPQSDEETGSGSATHTGSGSATHTGSGSATHTGSGSASGSGTGPAPVELEGEVQDHGTEELTGPELELEADDFYFAPTYIQAEAGADVVVTIVNEGEAPHTFTIDAADVDVEIPSGETATTGITIPEDGSLAFYCRFHLAQGMQGAFFTG